MIIMHIVQISQLQMERVLNPDLAGLLRIRRVKIKRIVEMRTKQMTEYIVG